MELSTIKNPETKKSGRLSARVLKNKKKRKKKHRSQRNTKISKLLVCGTNANGINSKKESIRNVLNADNPQVFMIQETKLSRKNQFRLDDYEIF